MALWMGARGAEIGALSYTRFQANLVGKSRKLIRLFCSMVRCGR